ncbi:restriction endonuclease subunit S [Microvirga sp. STR05]|uniref:Restriction endonuclease subunit S n=1 Tax=Hymenobacter duratus TaxID=2771356 RepID=A0ABR8JJU7_9BACT|nr:restriction endonuclease subunit S [Hymenobacter duratus]MBD2716075.1 restriction endonuclease subunit S [Hymenobacter duratus]MBR7950989.1 restriction endonuclease subunit S [Microvirga sp. STR05]
MERYEDYKSSGVEWMPKIPSSWEIKQIKHFVKDFESGVSVNSLDEPVTGAEIGILKTSCVYTFAFDAAENKKVLAEEIDRVRIPVKSNTIIISRMNTPDLVGASGYVEYGLPNLFLPDRLWQMVFTKENINVCLPKWLSYVFISAPFRMLISSLATGTSPSMKNISKEDILNIKVGLPSFGEQCAIARFLDEKTAQIDQLITQKQQMLVLLQEERAALINHAVTKGLDAAAPVRDSGLQWVPALPVHWIRAKLKTLVSEKITDGPHETPEFLEEGVPFLSAESIKDNKLDFEAKRGYITVEQHQIYSQKSSVKKNDILFCKSGSTTGKSALVETDEDFGIWSPLAIIRANAALINHKYLFLCIQSHTFRKQVENFWSFGTQPNIGMGALENLWISVPPMHEQVDIVQHVEKQSKRINEAIAIEINSISLLQEYRAALIAEAVTGQIDVRNYEPASILTAELVG